MSAHAEIIMARVLLTAFEPFGGYSLNASTEVVRRVVQVPPPGADVDSLLLPVVAGKCIDIAWERIERTSPDLVLALGQTGRGRRVCVEAAAHNDDRFLMPDNEGNWRCGQPVIADGPPMRMATVPVQDLVRELARRRLPVELSLSAGRYVCNHLYYGLLHRAAESGRRHQTGFLHVPLLPAQVSVWRRFFWPQPSLARVAETVKCAVSVCLSAAPPKSPDAPAGTPTGDPAPAATTAAPRAPAACPPPGTS